MFSDEARFEVYRHDGRIRVRRRQEELHHEKCIVSRVHAGSGGITVWGAFHAGGKSDLVVIKGNLDQHQYIRIIDNTMLLFARGVFQNDIA